MNTFPIRGIIVCIALATAMSMSASPAFAAPASGDDEENPVHRYNATLASTLFRSVFNGGDTGAVDVLIAPNAEIHTPYGEFNGPDGLEVYLDLTRRDYPDAWFDITSIDVYGGTVVIGWTMSASRFLINEAAGSLNVQVAIPGETTIIVADGQIAELDQSRQEAATTTNLGS